MSTLVKRIFIHKISHDIVDKVSGHKNKSHGLNTTSPGSTFLRENDCELERSSDSLNLELPTEMALELCSPLRQANPFAHHCSFTLHTSYTNGMLDEGGGGRLSKS